MRSQRVVHLDACGVEVPVLGEDIVCRVGREDEARRVRPPGRIEQAAVPEERAREQLGRAAAPRGALGEPVAPAEIDEAVHVLLMVVDDPFDRDVVNLDLNRSRTRFRSRFTTSRSDGTYCTFAKPNRSVPSLWKFSAVLRSVSNTTGSRRMSVSCRAPEKKNPHFPALVLAFSAWPFAWNDPP